MNIGMLLSIFLLLSSCASDDLEKFGARKHFRMKKLHLKSDIKTHVSYAQISYVASKENHCFESIDDREVYTVAVSNLGNAIEHFYYRSVSYDIKRVSSNGSPYLLASANEEKTVDLEVAYCVFQHANHWIRNMFFLGELEGHYASFRQVK
jgi:hypothetical protein